MDIHACVRDIKAVKIQGAESVATAALDAISDASKSLIKLKDSSVAKARLAGWITALETARPTEPMLKNVLSYVTSRLPDEPKKMHSEIENRAKTILRMINSSKELIVKNGAGLIKNNSVIFITCHSSTVVDILKEAKRKGKRFQVYNTETRPLFQGRKTAKELVAAGMDVTYFDDAAAMVAIKGSDLVLLGADAMSADGSVVNKIGSGMYAVAAHHLKIPVYICTDSSKFDPLTFYRPEPIEEMPEDQVWLDRPKNLKIRNPAFERIEAEDIKAIVSELGVLPPMDFVAAVIKKNKLFKR